MNEKISAKLFTDYIFTQSEENGALAIEKNFVPKERITVISNRVDVEGKFNPGHLEQDKLADLKKELDMKKRDQVITFIGRFVRRKVNEIEK